MRPRGSNVDVVRVRVFRRTWLGLAKAGGKGQQRMKWVIRQKEPLLSLSGHV